MKFGLKAAALLGSSVMIMGLTSVLAHAATVSPMDCSSHPASTPNLSSRVYTVNSGGAPMRTAPTSTCGDNVVESVPAGKEIYEWCEYINSAGNAWVWGRADGDTVPHWIYWGDMSYERGGNDAWCPLS